MALGIVRSSAYLKSIFFQALLPIKISNLANKYEVMSFVSIYT